MRPKIKAEISLTDWEAFRLSFNSFKTITEIQPNEVVYQLLGCLDITLLKLLYRKNNEPEGLMEESLFKVIKHIAMKKNKALYIK